MTKDLIKIIEENIKYLNSCLDLTEAHITWGTKDVKEKYSKIKINILNKMKEERVYKKEYQNQLNSPSIDNPIPKKRIVVLSDYVKNKVKEGYWVLNPQEGVVYV